MNTKNKLEAPMQAKFLFITLSLSLLLGACSNFSVTPASDQTTNNGVDAARIK
jgi:hypothetical protein